MTTGKTLIKAIREDVKKYPNISSMLLDLYDAKNRAIVDRDVDFAEDLFADNANERTRFVEYLNELEKEDPLGMSAKITESHVILHYQTPFAKLFSRKQSID